MNIRIGLNEYITVNIATIGLPYSFHIKMPCDKMLFTL